VNSFEGKVRRDRRGAGTALGRVASFQVSSLAAKGWSAYVCWRSVGQPYDRHRAWSERGSAARWHSALWRLRPWCLRRRPRSRVWRP